MLRGSSGTLASSPAWAAAEVRTGQAPAPTRVPRSPLGLVALQGRRQLGEGLEVLSARQVPWTAHSPPAASAEYSAHRAVLPSRQAARELPGPLGGTSQRHGQGAAPPHTPPAARPQAGSCVLGRPVAGRCRETPLAEPPCLPCPRAAVQHPAQPGAGCCPRIRSLRSPAQVEVCAAGAPSPGPRPPPLTNLPASCALATRRQTGPLGRGSDAVGSVAVDTARVWVCPGTLQSPSAR